MLGWVYKTIEEHPSLRSNKTTQYFLNDIKNAEKSVLFERKIIHKRISQYNRHIQSWPAVLLSKFLQFKPLKYEDHVPPDEIEPD